MVQQPVEYRRRDDRIDLIATASQPTVKTVLASKAPLTPEAGQIEFQVIAVDSEGQRPATRNFGRLVHALLESWGAKSVTYVLGTFCYLCVRAGQK
jgi:hypothetical protein